MPCFSDDPSACASSRIRRLLSFLWILSLALMAVMPAGAARAADTAGRVKLACAVCQGLAGHATGGPQDVPFFLRSFEPPNGGTVLHPVLQNAAFTYDNALALIALYACNHAAEARRIADAFVVAVENDRFYHDGRLRNAYRSGPAAHDTDAIELPGFWSTTQNSWAEDGYQVGSATGSVAWGVLALLTAYEETGSQEYLDSARKVMRWIDTSTPDPNGTGFYGGFIDHEPSPQLLTWKSTEHNTDVYAANTWLARLDGGDDWAGSASRAEAFVTSMWDDKEGRFFVGTLPDTSDPNLATSGLDALLWPLIAIPSVKDHASRVLKWTEANHGVPGGFDFNADRDGTWLEGTAQAALVYRILGSPDKAEPLFHTMLQQLTPDGLIYATVEEQLSTGLSIGSRSEPSNFVYFRLPHIGATAWAALAALDWNPFKGRSGTASFDQGSQCPQKP